jgi:hypothetical protein
MVATPLTASQVQALYPSSAAQNQRDIKAWQHGKAQKGARRLVNGTAVAVTKP